MKDHITYGSQTLKEKLGAISHMYMLKTSISSRIQKFRRGPLIIFPLDGQIQGEFLWVQQMATTWEDPIIFVPLN